MLKLLGRGNKAAANTMEQLLIKFLVIVKGEVLMVSTYICPLLVAESS